MTVTKNKSKQHTGAKDLVNISQKSQMGQEKSPLRLHIVLILKKQHNLK